VDISIILACYNESKVFDNYKEIQKILEKSKYNYEIIFVDDCSKDGTRDLIKQAVKENKNLKFLFHEANTGRGQTVTDGIKTATGHIVGFIDFDLETPANYIPQLAMEIENGADVATAQRLYNLHIKDFLVAHRWIAHKGYKLLVKLLLRTKLKDTEVGCKFFKKEKILPVLDEIKDKQWFWDTEIMIRSYYRGLKIKEVPSLFLRKPETGTSLKFFRDSYRYFNKLIKFMPEAKRLRSEWKKNLQ